MMLLRLKASKSECIECALRSLIDQVQYLDNPGACVGWDLAKSVIACNVFFCIF